jgi:hypothetical protein
MKLLGLGALPVFLSLIHAQAPERRQQPANEQPDFGVILCWNDASEASLAHDKGILTAVGRALGLSASFTTIGVKSEPCAKRMPDAACFGVPGGIMCQLAVIERNIRAATWGVHQYQIAGNPPYESFRRTHPESVGYAFQYADGARKDADADRLRGSSGSPNADLDILVAALVDYNLAALLGHEIAHTNDSLPCPVAQKATVEESGLWQGLLNDEQQGAIFAKHNADPSEVGADRCGLRHLRLLNERIATRLQGQNAVTTDFVRRFASDMIAFQISFGWRRYTRLPGGNYGILFQDPYQYSAYRVIFFATEAHGTATKPAICGYAAEIIVQAIQTTYKKYEGNGDVGDHVLALLPKGVETSWNGAPWTADSYSCEPPNN